MALPSYTETRYRIWHYVYIAICTFVFFFLIAPLFVIFPLSFNAEEFLVFILAIGYYITPALVGGASGTLISNQIAYHMKTTLDWSFASAMGLMLLGGVLVIYWLYNKLVGVDNIKLG